MFVQYLNISLYTCVYFYIQVLVTINFFENDRIGFIRVSLYELFIIKNYTNLIGTLVGFRCQSKSHTNDCSVNEIFGSSSFPNIYNYMVFPLDSYMCFSHL